MSNIFKLSKDQQLELLKAIKDVNDYPGDTSKSLKAREAKRKLISVCRSVVERIALKYVNRGISFQNLKSIGNKGLEKAIEKWFWRENRRYQFITYAMWFIRAEIHKKLGLPTDPEGYGEIK